MLSIKLKWIIIFGSDYKSGFHQIRITKNSRNQISSAGFNRNGSAFFKKNTMHESLQHLFQLLACSKDTSQKCESAELPGNFDSQRSSASFLHTCFAVWGTAMPLPVTSRG